MEKYAAIILAAGKGTRMNEGLASPIPKVMFQINGKPIISYSVQLVKDAGVAKVVVVVGYKREAIEEFLGDQVKYAVQEQQLGTGHAVMVAKDLLKNKAESLLVFYGDCPLYKPETVKKLIELCEKEKPTIAMLTAVSDDPFGYGRICRDEYGEMIGIIEHKDCTDEQLKIKEWNPGFYIFDANFLWENISKLNSDNAQKEFLLTDLIEIAKNQGKRMVAIPVSEESEALGINTQEQLKEAEEILKTRS
jgi:bifunctional UDP-N-acetylglucosamine pyrophosphorylase/glucosamine-1-phosphate N-acetyltransferase